MIYEDSVFIFDRNLRVFEFLVHREKYFFTFDLFGLYLLAYIYFKETITSNKTLFC